VQFVVDVGCDVVLESAVDGDAEPGSDNAGGGPGAELFIGLGECEGGAGAKKASDEKCSHGGNLGEARPAVESETPLGIPADSRYVMAVNTPPLLVGAALLFWGWQTGLVAVGAVLACILEGSRIVNQRWHFSEADFKRFWNLSTFLFFGAFLLAFLSDEGLGLLDSSPRANSPAARAAALNKTAKSMLLLFQWLPLVFFPLAAAQAYGTRSGIKLTTFSWLLRRRAAQHGGVLDAGELNVSFPYFAICVLGASTTIQRAEFFFAGMTVLIVWALWSRRVPRFGPAIAGLIVVLICAGGYAGNHGLRELQRLATAFDSALLSRFSGPNFNPNQHRSLLGAIGRVKGSGKIVLWIKATDPVPSLLREASYDQFTSPVWHSSDRDFTGTLAENDQTTWKLLTNQPQHSVNISRLLKGGHGLLALPNGAVELRRLPLFVLNTNSLGVLRAGGGPGYVSYDAHYAEGVGLDRAPTVEDERVSPKEAHAISQIANELGLRRLANENPVKAVEALQKFFQQHFTYSTYLTSQSRSDKTRTPLGRFLLESRKGHCEYFAAATVLLLREAGIPARYAVGYSVQEGRDGKYVVRERHTHAWCLARLNNAWVDVDTTPPNWNAIEAQRASWWEPVSDAWANLIKQFSRLRWSGVNYRKYLIWAFAPAALGLAAVIYRRRQWKLTDEEGVRTGGASAPGLDSEFYLVERRLGELGFGRLESEPLGVWLLRVNGSAPANGVPLEELLKLHYRYRFDPAGLETREREVLRIEANEWLRSAARTPAPAT
jgi:protein-glutamine gamma-glutamyltransferase